MRRLLLVELGRCGLVQRGAPSADDFEASIDVWEEALAGQAEGAVQDGFRRWRRTSKFYPSPADILAAAAGDAALPELNDAELSRLTGYPIEVEHGR